MRSTITARRQTVIPAPIQALFALGPSQRLEWLVEADGSIPVAPVDLSPVKAFRGMGVRVVSDGCGASAGYFSLVDLERR